MASLDHNELNPDILQKKLQFNQVDIPNFFLPFFVHRFHFLEDLRWEDVDATVDDGTHVRVGFFYIMTNLKEDANYSIIVGCINSLMPGVCGSYFTNIVFKFSIQKSSLGTCYKVALRWIPQNFPNKKSTLVQVMVLCHQAASHYLSQHWPRFMSPYGITSPQRVNLGINL